MVTDRRPFLAMLGPPLRRAILRHYNVDSCVASSAIGKLVLDHLGFDAQPVSVKAMLANQAFVESAERAGHVPHSAGERERWFTESGAHAIGLGIYDPKTDVPAIINGLHVALLVNGEWLWDLSIDQASRPQHGIVITEPFLGAVSLSPRRRQWLRGQATITWQAPGHGMIAYRLKPNDRRYEQHTNWRLDGHDADMRKAIADEAVMALRGLYTLTQFGGGIDSITIDGD
jgi:hypothetical protein